MGWVESVRTALPPLLYDGILTVLIVLVSAGLAWGIRPTIQFLLSRLGPKWSNWVAVLGQALCLLAGMTLIALTVGVNALGLTIAMALAFLVGMMAGGETAFADRIATMRIQRRKLYRVGDSVTLGRDHHGVVQQIRGTTTKLIDAHHATVLVRNSQVLRESIVVHHEVGHPVSARTASEPAALHSAPVTTVSSAAHPAEVHVKQAVVGGLQNEERLDERPNTDHTGIEQSNAEQATSSVQEDNTVADAAVVTEGAHEMPTAADEPVAASAPKQLPVRHRGIRSSVANTLTMRPKLGSRSARELR